MAFRLVKLPSLGKVYIPKPHLPRITAKFRIRITNRGHKIADYMQRWGNVFLRRSGASIRQYVITSFKRVAGKRTKGPPYESKAGKTPHLHQPKSQFIRIAIRYFADYRAREVLIGVLYSKARLWGWKHEHGRKYGGAKFPRRPFMGKPFRRWLKYGRPKIMEDIASKIQAGK